MNEELIFGDRREGRETALCDGDYDPAHLAQATNIGSGAIEMIWKVD